MPRPRPLRPDEARRTLVHRLGPRVDRLRQLPTRFGLRPYRLFLVWTRSEGNEPGRGDEHVIARVEVLPTPRVSDLTAQMRTPVSVGTLPDGTIRVDRISPLFTADNLSGVTIPSSPPRPGRARGTRVGGTTDNPEDDPQVTFFFEVVEDGRGDDPPRRDRFRLFGEPYRDAGMLQWIVLLQPQSEPLDRADKPRTSEEDVVDDDADHS